MNEPVVAEISVVPLGTATASVSLVIPAYNEGSAIEPTLEEFLAIAQRLKPRVALELIVVDDASTDDTLQRAEAFSARGVLVLRHTTNRGYGAAIKTGVRYASHDWIAITDADGT